MAVDADTGPNALAAPVDGTGDRAPDKSQLFLPLLLQNERRLFAYILTLLPHRADADDILQETSLVMWNKFDPCVPPNDFLAWARRIAQNKVLDFYKTTQRAQARLSRVFVERIAEVAGGPTEGRLQDDRRDALAGCIEKLPPHDRHLLALRFADGATTQSTSEQLGRSVDAVYKALAKLRQALFSCVQKALGREARP